MDQSLPKLQWQLHDVGGTVAVWALESQHDITGADLRARLEGAIKFVDEATVDPYAFTHEAYLQQREFLIHDGSPPVDDLFDELDLELEEKLK